jgi:phenylacetate-coenzyme A ligase PaaK-like adenylate-forming protein
MASNLLDDALKIQLVEKLNDLLSYVLDKSNLYKELYSSKSFKIKDLNDIKSIPYTLRSDIQKFYPFGHLCKERNELAAYFETSGSTGNPIPVLPDLSFTKAESFGEFLDYWMRLKNSKVSIAIVALPYEMNPMGLKYHMALSSMGITVIPASVRNSHCPPEKLIRLMQDLRPSLLVGRPLEIMRYAEGMKLMGIDSESCPIRKIFLTGETMSNSKWKRIEDLYGGAEIYSTYGLTELDTGLVSCSNHHYHLPNSPNLIVEVIDENGNDVAEGVEGEIVITSLDKNLAPLIRYKTEDIGRYYTACGCGEFRTPFVEVIGRKVDRKIIDGVKILPIDIEGILFKNDSVGCEYQLVVNSNKLAIKVEKAFGSDIRDSELSAQLNDKIKAKLGIDPIIEVFGFNELADKFGLAKVKGCRFFDITGLDKENFERLLKINICNGDDLK